MKKEEEILPKSYMEQRMDFINAGRPLAPKKVYRLKKVGDKKAAKIAAQNASGDTLLDRWFEDRRKEMTGVCQFCGSKTQKEDDNTYRHSIAHLLPKKDGFGGFPSVATHQDNWLELCFYSNSCHSNFDNKIITFELLKDSAEWPVILEKFKRIYPYIAEVEKRNIPSVFIPYINPKSNSSI